jgi:tRNA A-37 threonylcarbamoyl transferase component Bud32
VLDRYVLLEQLGAGGFGTVWLGYDQRLQREVAIKRIPRSAGDRRDARRRAAREALAAARLSHPAIVALYEAGADEDAFYLVSEHVQGQTLAELFARDEISDRELLRAGAVLADALAHAHARGVVHRDIKPHNVIVPDEPGGRGEASVKLTDFGVARIAGEQPLTRTGDVIGTFAYMAPEQADGREATAVADLYSLALTLYEGLAGFNPLRGATAAETARRLGGRVPALGRARRDLPAALCGSIDRALSADPARRGSLADLREALTAALSGELGERPARRRRPWMAPSARPLSRRERGFAALAAAALTALVLATSIGAASHPPVLWAAAAAALVVAVAPRAGFVGLGLIGVGWLTFAGRPGAALFLLLALAPTAWLLRSTPWLWSVPALAPALGAISLALAFPGLAGRCPRAWTRAALGALGLWWLALAEPLYDRRLLLGISPGTVPGARWRGSLPEAVSHALGPLLAHGGLLLAAVWALAAVSLPWVVRAAARPSRAAAALAWTTLLLGASGVVIAKLDGRVATSLIWGALLAALLAAAPSRRPPAPRRRVAAPTRAAPQSVA